MDQQLNLGITSRPKLPKELREREEGLVKAIIEYLTYRGHKVQRINSGLIKQHHNYRRRDGSVNEYDTWVKLAQKGTPDICGHHGKNGIAIYFECKIYPNTPEPEQIAFIADAKAAGCIAGVVYSLDEVIKTEGL